MEAEPAVPVTVADGGPVPGELLAGRFRLVSRLGAGGMGEVWIAEQEALGRRVAVKLLTSAAAARPEATARFELEAKALSLVEHEHILRVVDFGRDPVRGHFLATELLEGEALSELLEREGSLPAERAVGILAQILDGLSRAHAAGVVHRDLKPENVMLLRRDGRQEFVKVLDFGIAKVLEGPRRVDLTEAGMVYGTPAYLAPEQALGRPVDRRTDLYACGVILFRALTGRLPFIADSPTALAVLHVTTEAPPLPAEHGSPALAGVVRRALEKDPELRFRDAAEMRTELLRTVLPAGDGPAPVRTAAPAAALGSARSAPTVATPGLQPPVRATVMTGPLPRSGRSVARTLLAVRFDGAGLEAAPVAPAPPPAAGGTLLLAPVPAVPEAGGTLALDAIPGAGGTLHAAAPAAGATILPASSGAAPASGGTLLAAAVPGAGTGAAPASGGTLLAATVPDAGTGAAAAGGTLSLDALTPAASAAHLAPGFRSPGAGGPSQRIRLSRGPSAAELAREVVEAFGGKVSWLSAGGLLAELGSPTDTLLCAAAIHDRLAGGLPAPLPTVRAAVAAGEVIRSGRQLFGEAVVQAELLVQVALPGEVLFTQGVYLAMTRSEICWEEHPERDPAAGQKVYRLRPPPAVPRPELPFGGASLDRAAARPARRIVRAAARGAAFAAHGGLLGAGALARSGGGALVRAARRKPEVAAPVAVGLLLAAGLTFAFVLPDGRAERLEASLSAGRLDEAAKLADEWSREEPEAAEALAWQGRIHAEAGEVDEATGLLRRALEADAALARDEGVAKALVRCLDRRESGGVRGLIATHAGPTLERALHAGTSSERYNERWNALKCLEELGKAGPSDRVQAYGQDLRRGTSCDVRIRAAKKLGELGEPLGIPILEEQRAGAPDGNGLFGCSLGKAIDAALVKLRKAS